MVDAEVAWQLLGWMLAFWTGIDMQVRARRWWLARQQSERS
jgi:hypothetical protein